MKRQKFIITAIVTTVIVAACWWFVVEKESIPEEAAKDTHTVSKPDLSKKTALSDEEMLQRLHPRVRDATSPQKMGYSTRVQAVKSLPYNLATPDLNALMDFINAARPLEIDPSSWHALVDSIINVLRRQDSAVTGFTESLVSLYRNTQDPVLKDYSIQYLWHRYVDRDDFHIHETDPEARELILTTLIEAAALSHEYYSGAALMALNDITSSQALKKEPETQAQLQAHISDLNTVIIKAASSPETHKLCRISALQVCAIRGLKEILPVARTIAADTEADPNLRISAIAVIGQIGSLEQDKPLLMQLENQGRRLAYATQPALEKLSKKNP